MSSGVGEEVPEVPRPLAVILISAYSILLAFGIIASICTTCYLLWRLCGNVGRIFSTTFSTEAASYKELQGGEDSSEECADLEFGDDTNEEYLRRYF